MLWDLAHRSSAGSLRNGKEFFSIVLTERVLTFGRAVGGLDDRAMVSVYERLLAGPSDRVRIEWVLLVVRLDSRSCGRKCQKLTSCA